MALALLAARLLGGRTASRIQAAAGSNGPIAVVLGLVVVALIVGLVIWREMSGPGALAVVAGNAARAELAAEIEADRNRQLRAALDRAMTAEHEAARERARADENEQMAAAASAALRQTLAGPQAQTVCFSPATVEAINR